MREYRHKYGVNIPVWLSPLQLEQFCFIKRWPTERGGLGRYRHFKNMVRMTWPDIDWNDWLKEQIRELCNDETAVVNGSTYVKTVAMTGCAAAGKSFSAALFALAWWQADPDISTVIVCSTTKDMLKKRVWDPISNLHVSAIDAVTKKLRPVGRLIDSRTKVVWDDGHRTDDKHGVFGLAVAGGETQKALQHIKGIHAERVMVVVDEGEATPEAIFAAIANIRKGCQEFILVVLGNSVSHMDAHGQVCTPTGGWNSISIESESWPTTGVSKWQIEPGICLHFDGTKSPNVRARRTLHPYLYSWEDHLSAVNKPDYQQSMAYWAHDRGFWPPEGLSDRIFTEQMIEKYAGDGAPYEFLTSRTPVAFLDPAFGGDDCKLLFGLLGDRPQGGLALQLTESLIVPITAISKDEMDYQIARRVIEECRTRSVAPRQFGCDAVGIGRGVHAILSGEWSPEIQRVEGTGAPSDRPSSTADGRPATEVYDRMSTELWWSAREVLQAGQLRGLYPAAIAQLCSRLYAMKGRKYSIETKEEFKSRLQRSPDDADCFVSGTLVLTPNGEIPIEQLTSGDLVTTPFGNIPIEKVHQRMVSELTQVQFSNGSRLEGLGKHKIFTWEEGWVRLDKLSLTHTVESAINLPLWHRLNQSFTGERNIGFKALVDIIHATKGKIERSDFYTGLCGQRDTERYHGECSSTIRMEIGQIIDLETSNLWGQGNISDGTFERFGGRTNAIEPFNCLTSPDYGRRLKHGTPQKLARLGISSMGNLCGKLEFIGPSLVAAVGSFIKHGTSANLLSVHAPASNTLDGSNRNEFWNPVFAGSAGRRISQFNGTEIVTAPIVVRPLRLRELRRVYNLTLADHNIYFANGLLVDNCVVGLVEVARRNGLIIGTAVAVRADRDWSRLLREADDLIDDDVHEADYDDELTFA